MCAHFLLQIRPFSSHYFLGPKQRIHFEAQIHTLTASLDERSEQLTQLEAALVELQTDITDLEEQKEQLAGERDAALAQRATADDGGSKELASTRQKLAEMEAEAVTLGERHAISVEDLQRRIKSAEDDRELFRDLYSKASAHASDVTKENKDLEQRATLAEGQLQDGLAMLRAMFQGQVQKLQEEVVRWKGLATLLQEKDVRTNDEIRRRAAEEPELRHKYEALREENEKLRREDEARNEELRNMAGVIATMKETVNRLDDGPRDYLEEAVEMLSEPADDPLVLFEHDPDAWYVCQYVEDGMSCHEPFGTAEVRGG